MPTPMSQRVAKALAATDVSADIKREFGGLLLDSANRHAQAYSKRFTLMITVGAAWTMLALGNVELVEVGGLKILNLAVVDLIGLPIAAYYYYQSMLSATLLNLVEVARRSYFKTVWSALESTSLDELLVPPDAVSEDSAIGNLEIDSRFIRSIADLWTSTFGMILYLGPLPFFYWAGHSILERNPINATLTWAAVATTALLAARGAILFLQGLRGE